MDAETLQTLWYVLLGVLLAGYAVLDGFDLGVGILHLVARTDDERRTFLSAIGPIWDGNEVWLITFGGALFAAFPVAYAAIFSGFYVPFMLVLCALVFRAVSIEFRSKIASLGWRRAWDVGFFASSLLATFVFGLAVGNAMHGLPLDARGVFTGDFVDLLGPYPLLVAGLAVAMAALHGALFLYLKVPDGPLRDRLREWMWHTWGAFLALYVLTTIYTLVAVPRAELNFARFPWAAAVVVLEVLAIADIPRAIYHRRPREAFFASAASILGFVFLFGMAMWPNLVTASNDPAFSLTAARAASSPKTLGIMLAIAAVGMPLVLTYTVLVYRTFRGKVELDPHGY